MQILLNNLTVQLFDCLTVLSSNWSKKTPIDIFSDLAIFVWKFLEGKKDLLSRLRNDNLFKIYH